MSRSFLSAGSVMGPAGLKSGRHGFHCGRLLFLGAAAFLGSVSVVQPAIAGEALATPKGRSVLTVSGKIQNTNSDGKAVFDRAMLYKIGVKSLRTSTAWTRGMATFEGVAAVDLMRVVGAEGQKVVATALNDYKIEIPVSDFVKYGVLFALKMNGTELTRRDKGPVWVVYPRDRYKELQNQKADSRWIWQLVRLSVE